MKKSTVTFEVTKGKTEVIAIGTNGDILKTDITGTEVEKKFVSLLKELKEYNWEKQILDAVDITKYEEQKQKQK